MLPFFGNALVHAGLSPLSLCCCDEDEGEGGGAQFADSPTVRRTASPLLNASFGDADSAVVGGDPAGTLPALGAGGDRTPSGAGTTALSRRLVGESIPLPGDASEIADSIAEWGDFLELLALADEDELPSLTIEVRADI